MKTILMKLLILPLFAVVCFFVVLTPSKAVSDKDLILNDEADFHQYEGQVVRVIDGDTLEVKIYLLPGLTHTAHVRLKGVDAPELRAKCEKERTRAQKAKEFVEKHFPKNTWVYVENITDDDPYGRIIADIKTTRYKSSAWTKIDRELINEGLGQAFPYKNGKKRNWCK